MTEKDHCSDCPQGHSCSYVYEAMGRKDGESVLGRVFLAFLLPIFVFIGAVVLGQRMGDRFLNSDRLSIMVSFLFAAGVSFICILIVHFFRRSEIARCDRRSGR